jgi:metal-dependent amidase/aminoacylase/carboxypeptidase family protein
MSYRHRCKVQVRLSGFCEDMRLEALSYVCKRLKAWRAYSCAPCARCRRPKSGRGIIAEIGTGKPPIVVLRSDIDGLPIREEGSAPVKCELCQQK